MSGKKLPKNPRILLLTNDKVGLAIATYLRQRGENVVGLILHPKRTAKLADKIKRVVKTKNVFYADQIKKPRYLNKIQQLKPDIALLMWFGYLLKKEFIKLFPFGCINLHNSYLPYHRGKYPHVWAIYKNSKYGVSIHYVDEKVDTGDIIARREIKISPTDTSGTLYDRSLEEIVKLFTATWPKLKAGKIRRIRQNRKLATVHFAKDVEVLDCINLSKRYSGRELINQLRSRSFPDRTYAYFFHKGKKIYVKILLSQKPDF